MANEPLAGLSAGAKTKIVALADISTEDLSAKSPRRHRQIVFVFCFMISLVSSWHNLLMPFLAPSDLNFRCVNSKNSSLVFPNKESSELEPQKYPSQELVKEERCYYFSNTSTLSNKTDEKISCDKWEYDSNSYGSTLVSEWDLVCGQDWLISLGQSVFMSGYVSAMIIYGYLSDRMGRRITIFVALSVFSISGFLCLSSSTYTFFTAFRFFVSMGISGAGTTAFILLMELVGPKERSRYGIGFQFGWCTGYVALPAIAWLIQDWFYLQLVTIVPSIVLLAFWWIVPESPRWLKSRSKYSEKLVNLDVVLENKLETELPIKKTATLIDLFRTKNMRKKTLVLFFCWFVNAFIYFGLSLNTGNLGGNPYLNFFIAGAIEFPAYVIATHLIRVVGRRIPQMSAFLIGGLACLFMIPLMYGPVWLRIAFAMVGKFCITVSFAILYVISAEIFPTVVRTLGVGVCSVSARIASMIAPFIKELGEATHPSVPFAVFGTLSVLSAFAVLLLPETHMTNLPDTIKDGEAL